MSPTQALIRRNDADLTVSFTEAAVALKNHALEAGALVGKVDDAASQETAVAAQQEIASVLGLVEKARKEAKEPVLTYGRAIDEAARKFVQDVKEEQLRIAQLVADFQQLEQQRVRAAQQMENERLLALERERMAALAKATSHEAVDKIQEQFNNRAKDEAPAAPIAPIRAAGQRVAPDFEVIVTDIWLLAKAHPSCVKITPLPGEIKTLLKAGVKVAGVTARPILTAGVTRARVPAAIEV